MHYVWQNRLLPSSGLSTADGRSLRVINPGQYNNDAGPDFFNAAIEIDGQKWAGNVEIHVKASDWVRHHHHDDPAYDTVILHVVGVDDMVIRRSDGSPIPQFVMACNAGLNARFHSLTDFAVDALPCAAAIAGMPRLYVTDWLTSLAYERLYAKVDRIYDILKAYNGSWNETAYIVFARALGFGTNAEPFERLARATPLRMMRKHTDSIVVMEAILFGQAGMLPRPGVSSDPYVGMLATEYQFFAAKFGLRRPENLGWKLSQMRPQNFPFRRIAYMANLLAGFPHFISSMLSVKSMDEMVEMLQFPLQGYWAHHLTLGGNKVENITTMSRASINILIINAIIPLAYAYATEMGEHGRAESVAAMLQEIPAEHNRITAMFANAGIKISDAFTSQAVIELRREYCEKRKCLYCRIGHRHLAAHSTLNLKM